MNVTARPVGSQDIHDEEIANILIMFSEGISRFISVIDGNPGYDALLSHHLSETMNLDFSEDVPIANKKVLATRRARENLAVPLKNILKPSIHGIACYGRTRNNIHEFEFIDEIFAQIGINISKKNYALSTHQNHTELTLAQASARAEIERKIDKFYQNRRAISPGLVRQFNLYSRAFFNYLAAFTSHGAVRPKALVIANDHSPVQVALSMVMKGLGITRIYLQHAEVSESFPPLDFEHSILRNKRSLDIYTSIGEVRGKTYIIPRNAESPRLDALNAPLEGRVRVVIYPTARILGSEIKATIENLLENPLVHEVAVKEHPNASASAADFITNDRLVYLEDMPSDPHVAIVGNSSIVVELLSRGIPVFQNFDFDPVARDYYGFVMAGLSKEVTRESLTERFWIPYILDKAWLEEFSKWVPNMNDGDIDRKRFLDEMRNISSEYPTEQFANLSGPEGPSRQFKNQILENSMQISSPLWSIPLTKGIYDVWRRLSGAHTDEVVKREMEVSARERELLREKYEEAIRKEKEIAAKLRKAAEKATKMAARDRDRAKEKKLKAEGKQVAVVTFSLQCAKDPLEWLAFNQKANVFGPETIINAVSRLIQDRDVSVPSILREDFKLNPSSLTYSWLELKRSERSHLPISVERLDQIAAQIETSVRSTKLRRLLERVLLPALINYGTDEQLVRFLDNGLTQWRQFSLSNQVNILQRLSSIPAEKQRMEELRNQVLEHKDEFYKLKFANAEFFTGAPHREWSHAYAERMFMITAPKSVQIQYEYEVHPVFNALRPRMSLMDVRVKPHQRSAFLSRIRMALTNQEGFSCIRLSDGEGYLFPDEGYFDLEDCLNRERHWWGVELADAQRTAIRREALRAAESADIVGIPSIFRFIRDTSSKSLSLTSSVQGRGLLSCLKGVRGLVRSETADFTEDKFNVGLFRDVGAVFDLAEVARKVIIVSSVKPDHVPRELQDIPGIEYISLPTHSNTMSNTAYVRGSRLLPDVYPELLNEFESKLEPGALVIVAGGIIGKIFIGRAKERGAVALDLGHVIDDWVAPKLTTLR